MAMDIDPRGWHTLRRFKRKRFTVCLDVTNEVDPDLSLDDAETLEKVELGEYGVYVFRVVCYCDGREIASDYIGNSIYADPAEFGREHIGINRYREKIAPAVTGTYFADMLHNAIAETRKTLCDTPKLRCA